LAKNITLEDIQLLSPKILANLIYAQLDSNHMLYDKVEKMLLKSDPKALISSIKKDIASIRIGRKFISYYEAFDFAERVENIVDDIAEMVTNEKAASMLFKELILTDSKVYLRSDDSAGAIQLGYARAVKGWTECLSALSEDEVHDDIITLLVCDGFGVRDIFSEAIPINVLKKIYDEFYEKYQAQSMRELDSFEHQHVLKICTHFMKEPKLYEQVMSLQGTPLRDSDIIDIAREYQYADDANSVLEVLAKIKSVDMYRADLYYELKVWAHELTNNTLEATLAYKNWYEQTKSPHILKKYLLRLDGVAQIQAKEEALADAQKLSFSSALDFFYTLDEAELAAAYILERQHSLDTGYMGDTGFKTIVKWLRESYPQEVILLYRDTCERALDSAKSKQYPWAIKALKECIKIEEKNDTSSWKIESNGVYMDKLLEKHKRKPKFVGLFLKAFG